MSHVHGPFSANSDWFKKFPVYKSSVRDWLSVTPINDVQLSALLSTAQRDRDSDGAPGSVYGCLLRHQVISWSFLEAVKTKLSLRSQRRNATKLKPFLRTHG